MKQIDKSVILRIGLLLILCWFPLSGSICNPTIYDGLCHSPGTVCFRFHKPQCSNYDAECNCYSDSFNPVYIITDYHTCCGTGNASSRWDVYGDGGSSNGNLCFTIDGNTTTTFKFTLNCTPVNNQNQSCNVFWNTVTIVGVSVPCGKTIIQDVYMTCVQ